MKVVFQAGCGREELDAAVDEALFLKRFSNGATAAEIAEETGAPIADVIQAQVRRSSLTAAA